MGVQGGIGAGRHLGERAFRQAGIWLAIGVGSQLVMQSGRQRAVHFYRRCVSQMKMIA